MPDWEDELRQKYRVGSGPTSGPDRADTADWADALRSKYNVGGPKKRGFVSDALWSVAEGLGKGTGNLIEGAGNVANWAGGVFADDDERTTNWLERSGRKIARAGEVVHDRSDAYEPERMSGKVLGGVASIVPELAAAAIGGGAATKLAKPVGWLGKSLAFTAGAAPVTAGQSLSGNSMSKAVGLTDENTAPGKRLAADLALDVAGGLALDKVFSLYEVARVARRAGQEAEALRLVKEADELARTNEVAADLTEARDAALSGRADRIAAPPRPLPLDELDQRAAESIATRRARQADLDDSFGPRFDVRESLLEGVGRFPKEPKSRVAMGGREFERSNPDIPGRDPGLGEDLAPDVAPNRAPPEVAARDRVQDVAEFREPRSRRGASLSEADVAGRLEAAANAAPPSVSPLVGVEQRVGARGAMSEAERAKAVLRRARKDLKAERLERRRLTRELDADGLIPEIANDRAWNRARQAIDEDPDTYVASFDMNSFGLINKGPGGHLAGDAALKDMGATMVDAGKRFGVRVFRSGGDEFTAAGPREDLLAARDYVEDQMRGRVYGGVRTSASGEVGPTFAKADRGLDARKLRHKREQDLPLGRPDPTAGPPKPVGETPRPPKEPGGPDAAPEATDPKDPEATDPKDPEAGFATTRAVRTLAGGAVGGLVGGTADGASGDDSAMEGALIGALVGMGLSSRAARQAADQIDLTQAKKIVKEAGEQSAARAKVLETEAKPLVPFDPAHPTRIQDRAEVADVMNTRWADDAPDDAQEIINGRVRDLEGVLAKNPESEAVLRARVAARLKVNSLESLLGKTPKAMADRVAHLATVSAVQDLSDAVNRAGKRILEIDAEAAAKGSTPTLSAERQALSSQAEKQQAIADRLLAKLSQGSGEAGRNLRARRMLAAVSTPGGLAVRAEQALGRKMLPEEVATMTEIFEHGDRTAALEYVRGLITPSKASQVLWLRESGMLSRVASRARDVTSSGVNFTLEMINSPLRTLSDKVLRSALETGQRTSSLPSLDYIIAAGGGAGRGLGQYAELLGLKDLRAAARSGKPPREALAAWAGKLREMNLSEADLRNFDISVPRQIKGLTGNTKVDNALNLYLQAIGKTTVGADYIVKGAARESGLVELGLAEAANLGLKGEEAKKLVASIVQSPSELYKGEAELIAERMTFQNKGKAAALVRVLKGETPRSVGRAVTKLYGPTAGKSAEAILGFATKFTFPFATTTANIASRVSDYTPLGIMQAAWEIKQLKNIMASSVDLGGAAIQAEIRSLQRSASERISRAVTGGMLTGLGVVTVGRKLSQEGLMTGSYPSDPSTQAAWEANGVKANSLLVGDTWIPLGQLSPLGNLFSIGASLGQETDPLTGVGAAMRSVLDQPVVTGTKSLFDMFQEPEVSLGKYLAQSLSSFIPVFVSDIAAITDENRARDTKGGVLDQAKSRIPGLRQDLPLRRTVLGTVPKQGTTVAGLVNPFSGPASQRNDPAAKLLLEGRSLTMPRPSDLGVDPDNRAEFNRRVQREGSEIRFRLGQLASDPAFGMLSRPDKDYVVSRLAAEARREVRDFYRTSSLRTSASNAAKTLLKRYSQ